MVMHVVGLSGACAVAYRVGAMRGLMSGTNRVGVRVPARANAGPQGETQVYVMDDAIEASLPNGGALVPRLDSETAGAGGGVTGERAINLAAVNEGVRLRAELADRLDRDQHQRMRTAELRATREDRRATTHPMEVSFVATGRFEQPERRPEALINPARGPFANHARTVNEGIPEAAEDGVAAGRRGDVVPASHGIRSSRKAIEGPRSDAARTMLARPDVVEGPPTIPAAVRARTSDNVESAQAVATLVQAYVHASVAGGVTGPGQGGTNGVHPAPGAGGEQNEGSKSRPLGDGSRDAFDWNADDPLAVPYFRKLHAKIDPLWRDAFPKRALAELKQGTVILEFTVHADGSVIVAWPPVRPSGIAEFDVNCANAIRRASPFEPPPLALLESGRDGLRIRAPFAANNPLVR
jgi:TonB family protein